MYPKEYCTVDTRGLGTLSFITFIRFIDCCTLNNVYYTFGIVKNTGLEPLLRQKEDDIRQGIQSLFRGESKFLPLYLR